MRQAPLSVSALLLLALTAGPADGAPFERLLDDPDGARALDYCTWRFVEGGEPADTPDTEALLADEELGPERKRAAALVQAGTAVALASESEGDCRQRFRAGEAQHAKRSKRVSKRFPKKAPKGNADDPAIAAVQAEMEAHWRRDQAARQVYLAAKTADRSGAAFWASRLAFDEATAVDSEATAFLRDVLARFGWPDAHRFGGRTANRAWLLAQHADDDVALQEDCLARMAEHLESGGVAKRDYAYLFDRVAVNRGRLQRYGTQPDWACKDGRLELLPMEEPERVDERRATMGLGPAQADLDAMSAATCGAR